MAKHDVVLVPFPFDDLSSAKVRPAVCLTDLIGPHHHVVLAFITSRVAAQPLPTDLALDANEPDFGATGLRVSSTIQLHRLMTVTAAVIQRQLGELPHRVQVELDDRLRKLFELV